MSQLSKALRSERSAASFAALLATAMVLGARSAGWLEPIELGAYDRLLALRSERPDAGAEVIVVGYAETDIMEMDQYPIPDEVMARLLETILSYGPRAVGVDFHRDVLIPPGSERLEAVMRGDPRIVMVYKLSDREKPGIPPPRVLVGTNQIGLSDLKVDGDDLVRRAILYAEDEVGGFHLSLALQVALRWLAAEGAGFGADPDQPEFVRLGETTLPRLEEYDGAYAGTDARGYQVLIDYDGHAPFRTVSLMDVFKGRVGEEDFRDKMVFVGATAESVADLRRSPFGYWPGVYIHAHIADQLARYGRGESRPRGTWNDAAESAWVALWALLGAALGLMRGSLAGFIAATLAGAAVIGGVGFALLVSGTWIPVTPPLAAWLLSAAGVTAYISRREAADRKVMMQLFSRNVSRTVAAYMWERRDQFMEGGRPRPQRQHVTVLFVDVKSFTPVAEGLDPRGLMDWVNELMGMLAGEVEAMNGFVDDYFGDGMKAAFGCPVPREEEAEHHADAVTAVRCAISMERKLAALNESWIERGMPIGRLRVGIDSGFAVVGYVGHSDRMKYTVLGDTANTAARLESLSDDDHDFEAKPVRVLVSHRTAELLDEHFEVFDHGEVALKGKAQKIRAIEILRDREEGEAAGAQAAAARV
jgi:adenylate cyclase